MRSCRTMSSCTAGPAVAVTAMQRRSAEPFGDGAEHHVVRPEVVAPLTDAVRLVDDEEGDVALQQRLEEVAITEPFRRDVQDVAVAVASADSAAFCSRIVSPELMVSASTPSASSLSVWSFISAISGETTTVRPSSSTAGSW
jgi:hypothetical protein